MWAPFDVCSAEIFWVATAPLSAQGRCNVSPKGYNTFTVTSPTHVWCEFNFFFLSVNEHELGSEELVNGPFRRIFIFILFYRSSIDQDLTGSGGETISHLEEQGNGRITILMSAFEVSLGIIAFSGDELTFIIIQRSR